MYSLRYMYIYCTFAVWTKLNVTLVAEGDLEVWQLPWMISTYEQSVSQENGGIQIGWKWSHGSFQIDRLQQLLL